MTPRNIKFNANKILWIKKPKMKRSGHDVKRFNIQEIKTRSIPQTSANISPDYLLSHLQQWLQLPAHEPKMNKKSFNSDT